MDENLLKNSRQYLKRRRRRTLWKRSVMTMAAVVVFFTTYFLILPAITMERTYYCDFEEHEHEEDCYKKELICGFLEELEQAESHEHKDHCYVETSNFLCQLTETEGHVHVDECKKIESICFCEKQEHAHNTTCYGEDGTNICGLEEHVHTDGCYTSKETFLCGLEESEGHFHTENCYETVKTLICKKEEIVITVKQSDDQDSHKHTDTCYKEKLICEIEEHEHELICESNKDADLETRADWESTLPDKLTGVWAKDVLSVAESQLDYHESTKNFIVTEQDEKKGYTRYGAWYGDPYGHWCAMYVSFCLKYAEVDTEQISLNANCQNWIRELSNEYEIYYRAKDYDPIPGDLIFFDWDKDGCSDHVGIVKENIPATENASAKIRTIEGNASDCVQYVTYEADNSTIMGYAALPENKTTVTAQVFTDNTYKELADDNIVITVSGVLPKDVEVKAYPVEMVQDDLDAICAYDIEIFFADGTVYEHEGSPLTVQFGLDNLDELYEDLVEPEIYYIPEEGDPEQIEATTEDGKVQFETPHFSTYALVKPNDEVITKVESQEDLEKAVQEGKEYIQLTKNIIVDVEANDPIIIEKEVTLDLNGYALKHQGSDVLFSIVSEGTLTIGDSQNGTVNSGNDEPATISYSVMTSEVKANSDTGETLEATETFTVTSGAVIYGQSTAPIIEVAEKGTLYLDSGILSGNVGCGRAVEMEKGTLNLSGGYIAGFSQSSETTSSTEAFGGALYANGGNINLTGSVLANNTAQNGGAIYATDTKIEIDGSVISGNTANRVPVNGWDGHSEGASLRCGGGGIYVDGDSQIEMTSGYITMNIATDTGYFDGGGGVFLSGTADMVLNGGYVTGNTAQGGGGIRTNFGKTATVTMLGGYVAGNTATEAEGGGISIDNKGTAWIYGGYITNNKLLETTHWGGAGLFCADGSDMYIKNVLITNNHAFGLGGGLAGCPTGKVYLFVNEGAAIYANSDDAVNWVGGGAKNDIDKQVADAFFLAHDHEDYFCARNSTVTGTMLGGYPANWKGSADSVEVSLSATDVQSATTVMGLKSYPTAEAIVAAKQATNVFVNGNSSATHGGGILCNGNLIIGNPDEIKVPAYLQFNATKSYLDTEGNEFSDLAQYNFKFELLDQEHNVIETTSVQDDGTILFDTISKLENAGEHIYYMREVYPDTPLEGVMYDNTIYRVIVTVGTREIQLGADALHKITYYTITKTEISTSTNSGKTWSDPVVTNYTADGSSGKDSLQLNPNGSTTTFVNKKSDVTKITVKKVWDGGNIGADAVEVHLKQDGKIIETVTLNAQNNWSYTWSELKEGSYYSVEEALVAGYTASYDIITNEEYTGIPNDLGAGSWWVPATELKAGNQYMIVNSDVTKALYVTEAHRDSGFTASDVADVLPGNGMLTVGGSDYTSWIPAENISAQTIFTADIRTISGNEGIILKSNAAFNSWIMIQNNNNNYLKGTTGRTYSSAMTYDGTYLRGHNENGWNPTNQRTVIFTGEKFNTTTEQTPANAAKLYTLVSGDGIQTPSVSSSTIVITNTPKAPEYVLPETGGIGTNMFTIGGSVLMIGCLLAGYSMKRKRERRVK